MTGRGQPVSVCKGNGLSADLWRMTWTWMVREGARTWAETELNLYRGGNWSLEQLSIQKWTSWVRTQALDNNFSTPSKTGLAGVRIVKCLREVLLYLEGFWVAFGFLTCILYIQYLCLRLNQLLSAPRAHYTRLVGNHRMVLSNKYLVSSGPVTARIEKQKAFHCPQRGIDVI